jgi:hypothetical protein
LNLKTLWGLDFSLLHHQAEDRSYLGDENPSKQHRFEVNISLHILLNQYTNLNIGYFRLSNVKGSVRLCQLCASLRDKINLELEAVFLAFKLLCG